MSEENKVEINQTHPKIISALLADAWMIDEKSLDIIINVVNRKTDYQAVEKSIGRPLENTHNVETKGDTAIIPVSGPIFRYANLFTRISGGTSVQDLSTDLEEALNNDSVERIILNIDSPGGQANGISEFADMIFKARSKKEIIAYIGGTGASAAYWIASAASKIYTSDTSIIGSIGTVVSIVDTKEKDEKDGVKTFELVSTKSPNKRLDMTSDTGKAEVIKMLDSLTEIFISKVARNRGVEIGVVEKDFGKGGVFVGQDAVNAGMADGVSSFEQTLSLIKKEKIMSDKDKNPEASTEVLTVEVIKTKHPELADSLISEGATAERKRITDIQAVSEDGCEKIVQEAIADGVSNDGDVAIKINKDLKERNKKDLNDLDSDAKDLDDLAPKVSKSEEDEINQAVNDMLPEAEGEN